MSDKKVWQGWAIYRPDGTVISSSVDGIPNNARGKALFASGGGAKAVTQPTMAWYDLKDKGFSELHVTVLPTEDYDAMQKRIEALEVALRHYAEEYCEGICFEIPLKVITDFDCGGCIAKKALKGTDK